MFLTTLSLLCIVPGLLAFGCNVTCPVNSGTRCIFSDYCSGSYKTKASCDGGYCRCHQSVLYDGCTCLPHVSGCLIKKKPGTYVGLPSTDGSPETTFYGCVSTATNCEYDVHVIANYESSNGHHGPYIRRVAGDTYVTININGQSSKPLILVFTSYEPVNWQLSLPSGVVLNRILLGGFYTSKVFGYSNTNVEVVPRDVLRFGHGPDDGGGDAADNLIYLTKRFGPISSFSGSYRADRWTVNINRTPVCDSSISTHNNQSIVIGFEEERYTVNEGAENVTVVLLTNGPTDRNISVQYSTIDGTARAPMDYTAINQTSIIPAGTTRFEITIPIQNDELHEPSETFQVHLSLPDEPTICSISDTTVRIFSQPTDRPSTNTPSTDSRPFTFRPFTNRPSESTSGVVGGAIGGVVAVSLAIAAVFYISLRICAKYKSQATGTHVMQHTGTTQNGNSSSRPVATQPHPPPTTAFNLPRPEAPASVTITQPHMCLSITEAPPPTYNLHETFATYNQPSETPPPYQQPPTYDVATEETNCGPLNFPQD